MKNKNEFLEDLALLCEKYKATFDYSNDDSGTLVYINGLDRDLIELGFLDALGVGSALRLLKDDESDHINPVKIVELKGNMTTIRTGLPILNLKHFWQK